MVVALFLGLAAYLGYFLQVKSEDVINNSYNARLDSFSDRIVRGRILASDGTVLAQTQMDGGGNETGCIPSGISLTMRWAIPPKARQESRLWPISIC